MFQPKIDGYRQNSIAKRLLVLAGMVLCRAFTIDARAQTVVEADPSAYILKGYSGYAGHLFQNNTRILTGVFGYEIPKFYGGNDDFSRRGKGVTVKYDYFIKKRPKGLFVGADGNYTRTRYTLDATGDRTSRNEVGIGPRVGYLIEAGHHLYFTPWFSCGYVYNPGPSVYLAGEEFKRSSFALFPTVHVGWRL